MMRKGIRIFELSETYKDQWRQNHACIKQEMLDVVRPFKKCKFILQKQVLDGKQYNLNAQGSYLLWFHSLLEFGLQYVFIPFSLDAEKEKCCKRPVKEAEIDIANIRYSLQMFLFELPQVHIPFAVNSFWSPLCRALSTACRKRKMLHVMQHVEK